MCEKRISTENGVLTCDLPGGHDGFHHAMHGGGTVTFPDRHKTTSPTPFQDSDGNYLAVHEVEPLEIEWPQEAAVQAHRTGADTKAAHDRASKARPG